MEITQKSFIKEPKIPALTGENPQQKRAELKQYFTATWQQYESLFSLINNDEAYYKRPEPLRHPLIFYFGHTACFYINKLILGKYIAQRVNPLIEAVCAVGVDEMSWDDLNSAHYDWPDVEEVRSYRDQVYSKVLDVIDEMPLTLPIEQNSLAWIILMGCEHERIHLETSSVIMRMLPLNDLTSNDNWKTCLRTNSAPENALVNVAGVKVKFGKKPEDDSFGWDNEYGHAEITLNNFQASKFLVSNQEFLSFVKSGGYQRNCFWSEEGKQWLAYSQATMPRFWQKESGEYWQRNFLNLMPLPLDWPVEVNYLEAKAFCNWKNSQNLGNNPNITSKVDDANQGFYRLPTEGEWLTLRAQVDGDLPSWDTAPGNINTEHYASSCPVNTFEQGDFFDIVGNVWQWTESAIDGFDDFAVHPLYDDFSTPTFDGKHNLIKGGSWISTGNEAMRSSRYAFRRHFFQHAGFRYVVSPDEQPPNLADNHYETDSKVCLQLHNHFQQLKSLDVCITENHQFDSVNSLTENTYLKTLTGVINKSIEKYCSTVLPKGLDLGCSVGGLSFMLTPDFSNIDAIDFSARYIQHGVKLQQGESVRYVVPREGDIVDFENFSLSPLFLENTNKIHFSQGDLTNLKAIHKGYDVVIVQHALEKSYDPSLLLTTINERLNNHGLLVVVADYNFDENITDKSKWLGGQKINGENVTGFDAINSVLAEQFVLRENQEIVQVLKNNARSYGVSQSQLTVWQRKT
jgi:5-histidylcysteine sulfoxide synthase/putative 4-mercaptohistidine N1-methyltranferase